MTEYYNVNEHTIVYYLIVVSFVSFQMRTSFFSLHLYARVCARKIDFFHLNALSNLF